MARIQCRAAAHRMRKEYGEVSGENCELCCNRQRNNRNECTMVCIAYSNEMSWDGLETACGLFNSPFRGLRPGRVPLIDCMNNGRQKCLREPVSEDQGSFFDTAEGGD